MFREVVVADVFHAVDISEYIFCSLDDKLLDGFVMAVLVLDLNLDLNWGEDYLVNMFFGRDNKNKWEI